MLLVWGRRWYGRQLGHVGDFCEICRSPQPFKVEKRTLIGHFWFIPLGAHHAEYHLRTCSTCGTTVETAPSRYAVIARKPAALAELLASTFPDFATTLEARLAVEALVERDVASLAPETRHRLLAAPFLAVSPSVERRFADMHLDLRIGLAVLSLFVLPPVAQALWRIASPDNDEVGLLAGLVASVALILWQARGAKRRWLAGAILPKLGRALAPLHATTAEIEQALGLLRQHGHRLGKYVGTSDFAPAATVARPARPAAAAAAEGGSAR